MRINPIVRVNPRLIGLIRTCNRVPVACAGSGLTLNHEFICFVIGNSKSNNFCAQSTFEVRSPLLSLSLSLSLSLYLSFSLSLSRSIFLILSLSCSFFFSLSLSLFFFLSRSLSLSLSLSLFLSLFRSHSFSLPVRVCCYYPKAERQRQRHSVRCRELPVTNSLQTIHTLLILSKGRAAEATAFCAMSQTTSHELFTYYPYVIDVILRRSGRGNGILCVVACRSHELQTASHELSTYYPCIIQRRSKDML